MKTCLTDKDYQKYLEKGFDKKELAGLEAHMAHCAKCRDEFENWQKVREALDQAGHVLVPDGLKTRVMESVRKAKIKPKEKPMPYVWGLVALIALVLVAFMLPINGVPVIQLIYKELVYYMSQALYYFLWFMGTDIKTFFTVMKALVAFISEYLWVFALSTGLVIVGFISLILRGRPKLKAN